MDIMDYFELLFYHPVGEKEIEIRARRQKDKVSVSSCFSRMERYI